MIDDEFQKIKEGHWLYRDLKNCLDDGICVCDAVDHNAPDGCSNPNYFKFKFNIKMPDEPFHKGRLFNEMAASRLLGFDHCENVSR